jgi:hypothetical protein
MQLETRDGIPPYVTLFQMRLGELYPARRETGISPALGLPLQ